LKNRDFTAILDENGQKRAKKGLKNRHFYPFFCPFSSRIAVKSSFLKKCDFTAILDENGQKKG